MTAKDYGLSRGSRRAFIAGSVAFSLIASRAENATLADSIRVSGWSDDLDDDEKLNVATTVAPISSIVRNVGGDCIDLRGIVPDGVNSHTFEPAPSDVSVLSNADVLIANGLELERPTIELAESVLPDGADVILLGDQTIQPDDFAYDFSFPEEEGLPNPHLWTNVPFAIEYAELVAAALSQLDPAHAESFDANLTAYTARLQQLDDAVQEVVDSIPAENRKLLTYHDSWAYFAPNYGMVVIGAVQPANFSEPSPREVAELIDQIRSEEIPAIFGSEVFPSTVLEQIASESGANYFDDLRDDNPPGEPGDENHTFVGMMIRNLEIMAEALGGDASPLESVDPVDTFVPCEGN